MAHTLSNSTFYDGSELSHRSSTLPRRHRRHLSSESTFVISSRDCSPIRRRSPVYTNGSLPRSTHSIPATATHTKPQRTMQNKHIINEQNRLTAKSVEIYSSPKRLGTVDNRISNDRLFRTLNSGPSSLDSAKTPLFNSGPSSIDSGKVSYSRTSGHSSFESHASTSTTTLNQPRHRNSCLNGSPKFSPKHQLGTSKLATETYNPPKSSIGNGLNGINETRRRLLDDIPVLGKPPNGVPNSNSNSSITLQVTTSNESNIPNTKIFVQNSPVRSVITLENGKLAENSNVYIINNETTTNGKGELIKKSISKQTSMARTTSKADKENDFCLSETEAASETGDSLSMISEISPVSSMETNGGDSLESTKFTKNINNDATMNNGRKFSLPITNTSNNIVYKNVLKTVPDVTSLSPLNNKNAFILEDIHLEKQETIHHCEQMAGSVGNLRFIETNEKKLNSNCDLKNLQYESSGNLSKLNSNPAINSESIAHILQKNTIAMGSEPNLAINSSSDCKQKVICDKSVDKNGVNRRYSMSKENGTPVTNELYNFPSLTDLSFNFTSLAAQKILQGVSINSIDTLVELNMAQEKQQNNVTGPTSGPPAICRDYGMV